MWLGCAKRLSKGVFFSSELLANFDETLPDKTR